MWTSASGHSWAMIPAMNVPWPPSKSSDFGAVVVRLVLVVDRDASRSASGWRRASRCARCSNRGVVLRSPRVAVLDDGTQPGVEDEDLWSPAGRDVSRRRRKRGSSAGSAVDSMTLWLTPLLVGLGLDDVAEERHLAGPRRRSPERVALDDLLAEDDVVQLALRRVGRGRRARVDRLRLAPNVQRLLVVDGLALDVRRRGP